jgi:hypothetical protein
MLLCYVYDSVFAFCLGRLPMYSEAKLAFFIYLWHPKTKVCIDHPKFAKQHHPAGYPPLN